MTLSYSRYMYAEITLDQTVRTFILCHINAFRFFGGVPEIVKIDNLKAAIVEADFYEPIVQRNYAAFAEHYGFLPDPCRVRMPTDKGKVESNIKYVKNNCFKGREFADLRDAQKFLSEWLQDTANIRIHGTTGKRPEEVFHAKEQLALRPLPDKEFYLTRSQTLTVRTDCHVMYEGNLYSVPYVVLCQEKVQVKRELFQYTPHHPSITQPAGTAPPISAYTVAHIHLAKHIHNGCESLLYYKMPLYIETPADMHGCS